MNAQSLPKGIRQRGKKFFVDVTVDGQRKTATVNTLAEALAKREEIESALKLGLEVKSIRANAASWTLQQAVEKTVALPRPAGWKGTSNAAKSQQNAEAAYAFFGKNRELATISLTDLEDYFEWLEVEHKNADATINRKHAALSKVMKVAYDRGGVSVPVRFPPQRKEAKTRIRQISVKEENAMLNYCDLMGLQELSDFIVVGIDTGARASEILQLRGDDFNARSGVVTIHGTEGRGTKNGEFRGVPCTKRVKRVLQRRSAEADTGRMFDVSYETMNDQWKRMRGKLKLADDSQFTIHVMRHTCASRLVQNAVPLPVVQAWLGHKEIKTTMRYAHLYPDNLMAAVSVLEKK